MTDLTIPGTASTPTIRTDSAQGVLFMGGDSYMLIIGSAAGVVAMGMEKITFFWFLKNITLLAVLGYLAGIGAFLLMV